MLIASLGIQAQTTHTVINTNDSGLGSLRAAADSAVAGDTIRFSPSLIASGSDSIVLTSGEINFDTNRVVIKGLYTTTDTLFISGNNNSRIFLFYNTGEIVLDSLVLVNGNGIGIGGSGNGGAVYISNCSDTLFVKNSVISGNTTTGFGGGIYSYSISSPSSVNILNSTISGNLANLGGGGIYSISHYTSHSIIITNSNILGNIVSSGEGGGIHSASNSFSSSCTSSVNITGSIISGNTASGQGGGIYSRSRSFSSSSFSSSSSIIDINKSIISGNTTSGQGGGVYSRAYSHSSSSSSSTIYLKKSTISGNTSSGHGGGIYSISTSPSPNNSSSITDVKRSTISGNNNLSGHGGGVYSYAISISDVSLISSTVSGNTTSGEGGGIFSASYNTAINVINSTISGNTASYVGGGIYSASFLTSISSSITLKSSIIAENGNNSSGIYNSISPTIISNGYNIFSDTLSGTIGSDSVNVTAAQLNLQPLTFNGGVTQTVMPGSGSIAIDHGNPNDSSDAQNIPILGVRDVGAAEICDTEFSSINVIACNAYTVPSGNYTYSQSGIYHDTLLRTCGADSIITINLTFVTQYTTTDVITACGSYTWIDGVTYTSNNNTAVDTLVSSGGCDSIITLDLTINQPSLGTAIVTACNSYIWNGITYTSSNNTALDTLINAVGCDSIVTLDLTILNSTTSMVNEITCDSYLSPSGNVWISSGTYMDTISNSVNCDSIITINLTILNSDYFIDTVITCNNYTWIDGITYTSSNNTAIQSYTKSNGCDSIITLDLTINTTQYTTDVIVSCGSYTWIDGITYTSNNNTAIDTLVSSGGCDSIITLDLTIHQPSSSTETIMACDSYTSPSGNYVWTSSGTYIDTIPNSVGCDSIITINLTVLNSTSFTDVITSCSPIVWLDGVTYSQTTNGSTYTLINSQGCDSVVTLDFTLLEADTSVTRNYLTLTAQATNATYQWIDCLNGPIAGATNASFTATVNGDYQVEVTQNGCVDTSACFAITNVGVQEAELIGVSLYPNPTSDVLHIDKGSNQSLKITIRNSVGAIVYQSISKKQITSINMSKMSTGIYVVALKNELGIKVEKVVKR
jgi:hypothetical protein